MHMYRIVAQGHRDLQVVGPDGRALGSVHFNGWMTNAATGHIGMRPVHFLLPRLFRREPTRVYVDGAEIATITFGWLGRCRIILQLDGRPWALKFERLGLFNGRMRVSTDSGVPLVDLRARYNWFRPADQEVTFPSGSALSMSAVPSLLTVVAYVLVVVRKRQAAAAAA